VTPSITPSNSGAPTYQTITISSPTYANSTDACNGSAGLTKYITYGFAVTNGLIIYNNTSLTTKTYTSDPGNYTLIVYSGYKYAVTFDSSGNVNTVTSCPGNPGGTPWS